VETNNFLQADNSPSRKNGQNSFIFNPCKIDYPSFSTRKKVADGRPPVPEIVGQIDPVSAKTPIFNRYSLVVPQP